MTRKLNKGDGKSSRFNLSDIKDYLFMKVRDGEASDDEYGLYLDISQYGKSALKIHEDTYRTVLRQMRREYNGL